MKIGLYAETGTNSKKVMTLTVDVMFVCGLPIFVTLLGKIPLVTTEYMPNRKAV